MADGDMTITEIADLCQIGRSSVYRASERHAARTARVSGPLP